MNQKLIDIIEDNTFAIAFNMNDTFYYACADAANIDFDDFQDLELVIELYGYDAIVAYEALKRGHDPQVSRSITDEFKLAKEMILDMCNKGTKYSPFYELRDCMELEALKPEERKKISKKKSKLKDFFSFFYSR